VTELKIVCYLQHIPAWVVRDYLMHKDRVFLRSFSNNNNMYDCALLTPAERSHAVRYIADEWYDFLDDHEPHVGDCLLFDVSGTRNVMVVMLVMAEEHRYHRRR
jgi:hypothetical protein